MYRVGIFLFDHIELLDFVGPYEVFSVTSELNHDELFQVFTVSADGKMLQTVNGLKVLPDYSFLKHPPIDILLIPGGVGTKAEINKEHVLSWILEQNQKVQLILSVCSGARILGKLGLLDNIPCTTHHEVVQDLREIAPRAKITEDCRYVDSGRILTSAGISAGIDLSLYLVEKLYSLEIADKTRAYMEYGDWKN